jgi:DNA-binding response OmpR family regulator
MNSIATRTAEKRDAPVPGTTRRLLLVEDHAPLRNALNEVVQTWSYATSMVATLRQAQNVVLSEEPFAVIVSDYELPDGNGLGFLGWLRWDMQIHVPFLLISGGVVPARSAADDYEFLAKPFLMEEFRSRLEELSYLKPQPDVYYSMATAQTPR